MVILLCILLDDGQNMMLVTLQNEKIQKNVVYSGVYVKSPDGKTNGKNSWLKGEYAIWYNSENWMIGEKINIGTEVSLVRSTIDAQDPTLVGNNWTYHFEGEFNEAHPGDIIISNIKGKCITFEYVLKKHSMI